MKEIIQTTNAPAAIGPYSQAVKYGNMLYTSGQIAIDPVTSELKTENIGEETEQVMKNLEAVLIAAGMKFSNVIKVSIFLSSMDNFGAVNEVYASFFESDFPARETVEVAQLPKSVNVEISMIAAD